MDRWRGRVAVVTGASAGIGAAVVRALLRHGVTVVGVARRADRVQLCTNSWEIPGIECVLVRRWSESFGGQWSVVAVGMRSKNADKKNKWFESDKRKELRHFQEIATTHSYPGKLHAVEADLSKEGDIQAAFRWLEDNLGRVDILVNNAGVFSDSQLTEGSTEEFRRMLEVNVLGLTLYTKEDVNLMRAKGIDDGHIVNIGNVAGHWTPLMSEGAFYFGTKHAVRVLSEGLRREFLQRDSRMRVTVHEMMAMPVKQKHLSEL
ncbi:dehydrogenase/reductase SDR family member 11-like [Schistocerca cancellata]|uniref:dehydrogenase/reductase SDR family member 11-like n=1 Tax=Schistocerca cancellata TaxID=274614 RepID=UPI002119239C|nr:dehydrogenase/reductase SDR family member 11-like [Schistocerca cancellata]